MFRIKTDIRQYKCESPDKVEKLIRNWVIRPTDLIFSPENADWHPIGNHPTFIPLFDLLNEQLRNEPDTLVTRNPFSPPSAPEGVEINRADTDEITTMTRRTLVLRTDSDDTTEIDALQDSLSQTDEPTRKIGRHDLPEELFATAEIHGTFSRDGTLPRLDELAQLSETDQHLKKQVDDESTMIVEIESHLDDESTMIVEIETPTEKPAQVQETTLEDPDQTEEPQTEEPQPDAQPALVDDQDQTTDSEPELDPKSDDLVQTTEATAFERDNLWNSPVPQENDDDLILAEDFSTTAELDAPHNAIDTGDTQEFTAPDAFRLKFDDANISDDDETADFEIPPILIAISKSEDDSDEFENTENTDDSQSSEEPEPAQDSESSDETSDEAQESDEDSLEEVAPEIPEGYTVELPHIGPTDDDLAIGIKHSTRTEQEKERIFHTPTPQTLTVLVKETFILSGHHKPTTTLDLPVPKTLDNATTNNKTTTYIMVAVVLITVIAIIAALAT